MLNIDYKNYAFDGLSLFPLVRGEKDEIRDFVFYEESYVQRKVGLRTSNFKYIYAPDGVGMCNYCQKVHAGVEELYELEKDPGEKNNIADENKEKAAEMRQRLDGFIKKLDKKRNRMLEQGQSRGDISEDNKYFKEDKKIRKKLRSLGYMD
jgi:arylsulfatase A-like enzyme